MDLCGQKNLIILGVIAILITSITTGVSLWVYRSSGDIYLDRSRPGYLPDENEAEADANSNNSGFVFSETGELTQKDLDEYLKELQKINNRIKALADPYAPGPLSDESLGIPKATTESDDKK